MSSNSKFIVTIFLIFAPLIESLSPGVFGIQNFDSPKTMAHIGIIVFWVKGVMVVLGCYLLSGMGSNKRLFKAKLLNTLSQGKLWRLS